MKVSVRQFLAFLLLVVILIVFLFVSYYEINAENENNFLIVISFLLNIGISFFLIIKSAIDYPFSLNFMFWLFSFFFLSTVPFLRYLSGTYVWNLIPEENEILAVNLLILLYNIFYIFGRNIPIKHKNTTKYITYSIKQLNLYIVFFVSVFMTIFIVTNIGFRNIFSRSTSVLNINNSSFSLLTESLFRNVIFFNTVFHIIEYKTRKSNLIWLCLSLLCFLLACFPTGISRNMMASFYAGLAIIYLSNNKRNNGYFWPIAIVLGLIIVFPVLNAFRRTFSPSLQYIFSMFKSSLLGSDYDAHQMIISVMRYVSQFGFSFGHQFLGAFLFFVPRTIWSTKPIGTGATVISALHQNNFTNVSAPLISEFYINFGIIGVIIGSVFLGILFKQIDLRYWTKKTTLSTINIIYPSIIFMVFFVFRGDFMSGWAYTFAQLVVGIVVFKFIVIKNKY